MDQPEQRRTERLLLAIPIRVMGTDLTGEAFTEDTKTLVINQAGARIALEHRLAADDSIRIVNLENYSEADFRIVGPTRLGESNAAEWGVECSEPGRNIWGIELPPPLSREGADAGALLECRACESQGFWPVTLMEVEVLNTTGLINRACTKCKKITYWTYVDVGRRPRPFSPNEPVAPPPRDAEVKKKQEKRREKRMAMKLPVLVREAGGEEETSKSENVSKGGLAVSLALDLKVGDQIQVICPYTGSQDIPQKGEVRQRAKFDFGGKRMYGIRYVK
jgi:PilZ domain-containing protein